MHNRILIPPRQLLAEGVPPHNLDAEMSVIGAIFRDPKCADDILASLIVEDFYSDKYQKMFAAIKAVSVAEKPIDIVAVGEELAQRKQLADVGGADELAEIYFNTLTAANASYYADIVRDKSRLRSCIHVATDILREAYAASDNADEIISTAEGKISALAIGRQANEPKHISEVLSQVLDEISKRKDENYRGIPTGFIDLDRKLCGMREGQVLILAGRPSMGKTAFAINIAEKVSVRRNVLVVSLEMSENELTERMLCGNAKVNSSIVRSGSYTPEESTQLVTTSNKLSTINLHIADMPGAMVNQITSVCRHAVVRKQIQFIVVDYLQLIEPEEKKGTSVNDQVSAISRRIKRMARELKVPVLLLSQLNREVDRRPDKTPKLSDLRDSGSIEQDADVVMLIHRPDYYEKDDRPGIADILVAKNRTGPIGKAELKFNKHYTEFENIEPIYDVPDRNYSDF